MSCSAHDTRTEWFACKMIAMAFSPRFFWGVGVAAAFAAIEPRHETASTNYGRFGRYSNQIEATILAVKLTFRSDWRENCADKGIGDEKVVKAFPKITCNWPESRTRLTQCIAARSSVHTPMCASINSLEAVNGSIIVSYSAEFTEKPIARSHQLLSHTIPASVGTDKRMNSSITCGWRDILSVRRFAQSLYSPPLIRANGNGKYSFDTGDNAEWNHWMKRNNRKCANCSWFSLRRALVRSSFFFCWLQTVVRQLSSALFAFAIMMESKISRTR